jgi:hypothetical protein
MTCAEFPGLKSAGPVLLPPKIRFTDTLSLFGLIPAARLRTKVLTVDDAPELVSGARLSFP